MKIISIDTSGQFCSISIALPKNIIDSINSTDRLSHSIELAKNTQAMINKYNVKVGTTLEFWEQKDWITKYHPYGWVQWYCDFYMGKRCSDDERQINRWIRTAGPNSRFRRALINLIKKKKTTYNDFKISPKRRQTLQHWGYVLTKRDCK